MPAGIIENVDRGIVGYREIYGGTWHGMPEYAVIDGPVPVEECKRVLGYTGQKWPVVVVRPDGTIPGVYIDENGVPRMEIEELHEVDRKGNEQFVSFNAPHALNAGMYAIVSDQDERVLSANASVGSGYRVFQNNRFLDDLADLLDAPGVEIESCGTLHGLAIAFINLRLGEFVVDGDVSPTVNKIMVGNSFNGGSITGCEHDTRIVCMNTMRMAEASGEVNNTLLKRKHTRNAGADVKDHMAGLEVVKEAIEAHHNTLNWMAAMPMNTQDVDSFLAALFPIPEPWDYPDTSRRAKEATARRDVIQTRFDDLDDLQGPIKHTRYAALQAVTNWTNNIGRGVDEKGKEGYDLTKGMPGKAGVDKAEVWYDLTTPGKPRDTLNQHALKLLSVP